jgi:zinc transporter, ZIP family
LRVLVGDTLIDRAGGGDRKHSGGGGQAAGSSLFDTAAPSTVAFVLAFAGGAILTMLADTMMPEAFEHGGKLVGLATTLGFGVAFMLSALE